MLRADRSLTAENRGLTGLLTVPSADVSRQLDEQRKHESLLVRSSMRREPDRAQRNPNSKSSLSVEVGLREAEVRSVQRGFAGT